MRGQIMYRYIDPDGIPKDDWYFLVDLDQNPTGSKDAGGMALDGPLTREAFLAFSGDDDLEVWVGQGVGGWSSEFRRFR